jgi:protocatechuate 3,4-dioxygenase beta subunit
MFCGDDTVRSRRDVRESGHTTAALSQAVETAGWKGTKPACAGSDPSPRRRTLCRSSPRGPAPAAVRYAAKARLPRFSRPVPDRDAYRASPRRGLVRGPSSSLCLFTLVASIAAPGLAAGSDAVSGTVLGPDGKAASAATVYLMVHDRDMKQSLKQTRSAADGSFAFPALDEKNEQPDGVMGVKAGRGAWGVSFGPWSKRTGIEIRLPPARELTGTVLDPAGKPLAGVSVRVSVGNWGGWFSLPESFALFATVTDAAGRFRLRGLARGAQVNLEFRHPRCARWGRSGLPVEQQGLTVQLPAAGWIAGRALYEGNRKPAAGLAVTCQQEWDGERGYAASAQAVTDRSGRFRLDRLPPGSYVVSLARDGAPGGWVALDRWVAHVASGKPAACEDLVLTRGGMVTGRVTDRETGLPLSDAQVGSTRLAIGMWRPGPGAKTGADGIYRLRLPTGKWRIEPGYRDGYLAPWQEQMGPGSGTEVDVALGRTVSDIHFTMRQAATVTGVVLGPENRPDPKAEVSSLYGASSGTREDGSFTLGGLKPGEPATLTVRGGDPAWKAIVAVTPTRGQSEPVTIRLTRCLPVTGMVADDRGRPLRAVQVRAERPIQVGDNSTWFPRMDMATTGDDGRFTLWLLPGLEHTLKATLLGYGEAQKTGVAVQAAQEIGVLTMTPANRSVAGRVTDPNGDPVAGVRVSVYGEGQTPGGAVTTDAAGRYRVEHLAPGKVQVNVSHPTYGFDFRDNIETGASGVDFVVASPEQTVPPSRLKAGDPAPELTGVVPLQAAPPPSRGRLTGKIRPRLQELRGQVVLLMFGAAYNPAVEAASEQLAALHRKYAGRGVAIMAIYDASLPAAETAAYVKARRLPYPVAIVPASPQLGWNSTPFKRYGVYSVPSLFLIDRQGTLRAVNPPREELEAALGKLVSRR